MKGLLYFGYEFHEYWPRGGTTFHPLTLLIRAEIVNQLIVAIRFADLLPCEVVSIQKDIMSGMNGWTNVTRTIFFTVRRAEINCSVNFFPSKIHDPLEAIIHAVLISGHP